jgi:hypothetical protein
MAGSEPDILSTIIPPMVPTICVPKLAGLPVGERHVFFERKAIVGDVPEGTL